MKRTVIGYISTIMCVMGLMLFGVQSVSASITFNDMRELTLGGNSLKLYMGQDGNNFYLDSLNTSGKPLSCEIKADSTLIQRGNCDDQSFSYYGGSEIKIYVQLDNDQGTWIYSPSSRSFTSALRGTTDVTNNNGSNSNSSSISLSPSSTSVSTSQYVGLGIRIYNSNGNLDTNFEDEVRFTISKMDSYGSYYTANSSDYYLNNSRYDFSSSDDGYVYLSNYLQFYTNGTYKVRVENTINGAISDVTITVGGSSSCTNCTTSTYISLDTSTTNPTTSQYISTYTTIKDSNGSRNYNYQGTVRYIVEKRDSSNYNWYTASSSDYSLSPTTSYFSNSDQGYKSISSHVVFYNNGYYRIKAYDDTNSNSTYGYKEVTVGGSSSCTNCTTSSIISLENSNNNPTTSQYISTYTTIKDSNGSRNYNYQGTVRYTVEKRDSSNYNWYTASSSDYSLSPTTSYFSNSDQGYKSISSHVVFYNNGYYRLKAYDDTNSNVYGYSYFTIGNGGSSSSSTNRFDLSTNTTTPGRDNFANLTIVAKDNNGYTLSSYNNRVRFQVYRRTYTSDSWTEITSSSLDNSSYRIYDTTYTFPSYNNGSATITNFIKFYSDSYDYKVRVVDDTNSNTYGEIIYYLRNTSSAGGSTSSNSAYRFGGTLDAAVPELNSYFNVRLYAKDYSSSTVTNYNRTIKISIERKSLAGSTTWSSASSTYCRLDRSSYTFSTSDYGYATLRDIAKCSKKGFYRLKFVDESNSSVYGYIYFTIVDTDDFVDSLAGFTSAQKETVHETYRTFMSKVNERELNSTTLARNSTRASTWRNYYNKLNALAYNKTGRLRNYSAWVDAANEFTNDYTSLR